MVPTIAWLCLTIPSAQIPGTAITCLSYPNPYGLSRSASSGHGTGSARRGEDAEEVGLSVTTVSRALNDYPDVSPQTKERIRQAAQEMGYHPHTIARKLQKRRTDTIGFVIPAAGPRFSDPFFIQLITGIGDEAARQEFDFVVSTCAPGDEEERVILYEQVAADFMAEHPDIEVRIVPIDEGTIAQRMATAVAANRFPDVVRMGVERVAPFLASGLLDTDAAAFGIDIWMTTTAINEGLKICQTHLGAKIHDPKDPAASLGPMFVQVVGTLFSMMTPYEDNWKSTTGVETAPIFGQPKDEEAEPVPVTPKLMMDKFRAGWHEKGETWQAILTPDNLAVLEEIAGLSNELFEFPDEIVLSMTPLYYGRAGSMAREMEQMSSQEAEEVIRAQARVFEQLKPYLIERWDSA